MSHRYRVRIVPERLEMEVQLFLDGATAGPLRVMTPTWVPGAYGFMKYGRDLFEVKAFDAKTHSELTVVRDGWPAFVVEARGAVEIRFKVVAADPAWGELVGFIGSEQALLLGTHLLFAPSLPGPCRVEYELPKGWPMHHPSGAKRISEGVYEYPSYPALLDAPIAAGRFERRTRELGGVPFHFVFFEKALGYDEKIEAFLDALARIADRCHEVFGSFPFEDYTFFFTFNPLAKWGLEHANSTTIALDEDTFFDDDSWARGLRVAAHELFHAWNVCRLKPAPLGKPDFERGSFPDALWVSEGVTRYYEFLLLARAGVIGAPVFFSNVVNYWRQLSSQPAASRVSLADASRATFLNHNKYPGSVNTSIDYYDAGMLVAFDLDVALRGAAKADSLDAAFGAFYRDFVGQGDGFTHAQAAAFFEARVPGLGARLDSKVLRPGTLSIVEALEKLGFEVVTGKSKVLGLVMAEKIPAEIANVLDDSPAGLCGLAPTDVIERVNEYPFKPKVLAWATANLAPVFLEVRRGSRRLAFDVEPAAREQIQELRWVGTEAQAEAVRGWLGQPDFKPAQGERISLAAFENFHGIQKVV
ncbi:MAG TPA: hypothetical protein VGK67_12810 [Myxococcales bacterium]|jgi:predicted metalloprotease with PDZ domain